MTASLALNSFSMASVGPPAPEQKSTYVNREARSPRTLSKVSATKLAGEQGCRTGSWTVHRRVRQA